MTSLQDKKIILQNTLKVLIGIKEDTALALDRAREEWHSIKDEDSDSERCCNTLKSQQTILIPPDGVHTQMQLSLDNNAQKNDNETTRLQQVPTPGHTDNTNEEDMSIASEDESVEDSFPMTDPASPTLDGYDVGGPQVKHSHFTTSQDPSRNFTSISPLLLERPAGLMLSGYDGGERRDQERAGTQVNHSHFTSPQDPSRTSTSIPPLLLERPAGMLYEVRITSAIKNEVPLLTKINPALQVDVVRLHAYSEGSPLFWSLQVECVEHQVSIQYQYFGFSLESLNYFFLST